MIITSDNNHVFDIAFKAIQQTNTMITFWDNELICRFANNGCSYWFGKKPVDMIDKMHMSQMLGYLFEKNLKYINGALSGETQIFERIIDTPDGMIRKGRVVYTPELIDDKVVGFYAYLFDIGPLDMNGQSSSPSASSYLANSSDQMLYEVKQELEANLLNKFPGLATLASHHMVPESKLKRDFKQKYEIGIFSYYRQLQMKLAADYIREKKYTKSQLAMMFNFSNPSNFSTCYNKYLVNNEEIKANHQTKLDNEDLYIPYKNQTKLAIAVLDKNLCFLDASENWIKYNGLKKIELIGSNIFKMQDISQNLQLNLTKSLKGTVHEVEEHLTTENGLSNWTIWNISPWQNAKGVIQGLILITKDITSTKNQVVGNTEILL